MRTGTMRAFWARNWHKFLIFKENFRYVDSEVSREYRLVHAKDHDRLRRNNPEFRCEACPILKSEALKKDL